ncbi:MAG: hypothetical protein AB1649_03365 [Chloroflexota bacterium]
MRGANARLAILFAVLFLVYAFLRVAPNLQAISRPREPADTTAYLRISTRPLFDVEFWGSARPFVFPLLLKITRQDVSAAAAVQLGFSILAWGLLALSVSASLRTPWLKPFAFALILALGLVRHLASWDFVMMTESLSVSFFVLFLACGIWLIHGWRADKVIVLLLISLFLAFTRDTNAYLLLMLAGLLLIAVIFRWAQPRVLILIASFAVIFLLNNSNAEISRRWLFPLTNLIGQRVLPKGEAITFFESCGMPVTPELINLTGEFANANERAFFNDPALSGFRAWLGEHGKSCYMRWLFTNPVQSVSESLREFENLVAFDKIDFLFSRRYEPLLPWRAERLLYPIHFTVILWLILTLAALIAVWKQAWKTNPLWSVFILLCLPILPHLFITWHGDAMAPERHALSVGLQLALSFWILLFLLADHFLHRSPAENKST